MSDTRSENSRNSVPSPFLPEFSLILTDQGSRFTLPVKGIHYVRIGVHKLHRRLVQTESRKKLDADDHHVGHRSLAVIPEIKKSLISHTHVLIRRCGEKILDNEFDCLKVNSTREIMNNFEHLIIYAYYLRMRYLTPVLILCITWVRNLY